MGKWGSALLSPFVRDRSLPQVNFPQFSTTGKEEMHSPVQVLGMLDFWHGFGKSAVTRCGAAGVPGFFLRALPRG